MSQTSLPEILWSPEGLDHMSDMNMVHYYKPELRRVIEGENALKLLGEGIHTNLTKRGILRTHHRFAGKATVISPMLVPIILEDESK